MHDAANIGRKSAARHLTIGDELHELVLTAGRVNGRDLFDDDAIVLDSRQFFAESCDGLGLVTFDGDETDVHLQGMHQDPRTPDDRLGSFAHQDVIAADVRLAFNAIEYQVFDFAGTGLHELLCRRKNCAAEPNDAPVQDAQEQVGRSERGVVVGRGVANRFILAVGLNNDARGLIAITPRHRPALDRDDRTGCRCMNGHAHLAVRFRNGLPLENAIADVHDRLCRFADMLLQRED